MSRERNSRNSELAYANTIYATADAIIPTTSAGRRPYRSENRPQIGALSSCATENDDTSNPTTNPFAPNDFA